MPRLPRLTLIVCLALTLVGVLPLHAQTPTITFTLRDPQYTFNQDLSFALTAQSAAPLTEINLFYRAPREARAVTRPANFVSGGNVTATVTLDLSQGLLPPFTTVEYWWELKDSAGASVTSPRQTLYYEDNRWAWEMMRRQVGGAALSVHWDAQEGDSRYGQTALEVAAESVARANRDINTVLPATIQIYLYASQEKLQPVVDQLNLPWAEGLVDPRSQVVIVAIPPTVEAGTRLERDLPHELTHLLVMQMTGERYARVPAWLDEGLATLNETSPDPQYLAAIDTARKAQNLLSLAQLCRSFSEQPEQITLAYAQSESVVRFIRERYGAKSLVALLQAYADGADCENGVRRALGISFSELEVQWLRQRVNANPAVYQLPSLAPWLVVLALLGLTPLIFLLARSRS